MAPLRRRASRRVVKSTFQECFEYDIPGFRGLDGKRPGMAAARNRPIPNTKTKSKPKQESSAKSEKHFVAKSEQLKKPMTNVEKEKPKNVEEKTKENNIKNKSSERLKKVKSSLTSIRKVKNTFLGSDYKRFKAPFRKNTVISKTIEQNELPTKIRSKSSERNFESKTWQPVVSLEKIRVNTTKSSKHPEQSKEMTPGNHCSKQSSLETLTLATRLKNALKDPMAEREDMKSHIPDNKTYALMEVVKESRAIKARTALSRKAVQEEERASLSKKTMKNTSNTVSQNNKASIESSEGDSAIEDWPEGTSEASEEEPQYKDNGDAYSASAITDWTRPQLSYILLLQKEFQILMTDLTSYYETLRNILQEKNSLIATLNNKLESFNNNTCHEILNNILLDYDEKDPKNPATVIIKSILEYPNSRC